MEELDSHAGDFRLCQLKPEQECTSRFLELEIVKHNLNDAPAYCALSYVWGDPNLPRTVKINGEHCTVTKNLFEALFRLRRENTYTNLWIDAICIDQKNHHERAAQVRLMDRIYSQSTQTLLVLGNDEMSDMRALDLVRAWAELWPNGDNVEYLATFLQKYQDAFDTDSWTALEHLMSRPYWTRIWTYQEVVLSPSCEIFYDRFRKLPFSLLEQAVMTWTLLFAPGTSEFLDNNQLDLIDSVPLDFFISLAGHRERISNLKTQVQSRHSIQWDMWTLLRTLHWYEATDSRDKIFALYGVAERLIDDPEIDYISEVGQIYLNFTSKCIIEAKSLGILESSGIGVECGEARLDMPSWVPDFRASARWPFTLTEFEKASLKMNFDSMQQAFNDYVMGRTLSVKGMKRDVVTSVVPKRDDFEENWYELIPDLKMVHPTGMSMLQVFFRTLIMDDSSNPVARPTPPPQDLPGLAIGFLAGLRIYLWAKIQGDPIYDEFVGRMEDCDGSVEEILTHFRYWTTGDVSADMDDGELLTKFTGHPSSAAYLDISRMNLLSEEHLDVFRESFHRKSRLAVQNRSLITCDGGHVGLGPVGTNTGDLVCTFDGCSVPFILRSVGDQYVLVGSCYMYGLMHSGRIQFEKERDSPSTVFKIT